MVEGRAVAAHRDGGVIRLEQMLDPRLDLSALRTPVADLAERAFRVATLVA